MTRPPAPARVALWWVDRYTATAPADAAADRRDEVRSDVHEQLVNGGSRAARRVLARAVRGVPADLSWRFGSESRTRGLSWHLAHPASLLAALLLVLVPLEVLVDVARERAPVLRPVADGAASVLLPLAALAVAVGAVGGARWCARPCRPDLRGVRRGLLAAFAALWALSYLWRFAPDPLAVVSTAAWVGVGATLVGYLAACVTTGVARLLDLGKVSS